MIDLKQKELADWQEYNFGISSVEDMVLGMSEELGELAHWILKRKQGIREGANGNDCKAEIADAFADVVVFGIQAMTYEGIDAEDAFSNTVMKVLKRDWRNNPQGIGETQHKQPE